MRSVEASSVFHSDNMPLSLQLGQEQVVDMTSEELLDVVVAVAGTQEQ